MPAFPKAQNASFSAPLSGSLRVHNAQYLMQDPVYDVTAAGDTQHEAEVTGIPIEELIGQNTVKINGVAAKGQLCTFVLPNDVKIKCFDWSFTKRWPLVDVTGCGDATTTQRMYSWGRPVITGAVRGIVKADGPIVATRSMALTCVLDQIGTLAGTAVIAQKSIAGPFRPGGPMAVALAFQFTGAVTCAGSPFGWATGATDDPAEGALTFDLDSGETLSWNALAYEINLRVPRQSGGPLPMTVRYRRSAAA